MPKELPSTNEIIKSNDVLNYAADRLRNEFFSDEEKMIKYCVADGLDLEEAKELVSHLAERNKLRLAILNRVKE